MSIHNFMEIRRDGKVIDESMSAEDVFALGNPEKIVEVKWRDDARLVSIHDDLGMLAKVVPGRNFVAINGHDEPSSQCRKLFIMNADGSKRLQLSNVQNIRGANESGKFCWFEPSRTESSDVFGVVFNVASDDSMFQLDIDATSGAIVGTYPVR